jgi:hypothetical protein
MFWKTNKLKGDFSMRSIKGKLSAMSLIVIFLYLTACMAHQPIKPIVQHHPMDYKNYLSWKSITIAVVPCNHDCSVQTGPGEPCRKLGFDPTRTGVCPTKFIILNESSSPLEVDPSQITCTDVSGTVYQPFDSMTAAKAVIDSETFKTYVKGTVAGAIAGAAVGAAMGAILGAAIGGRGMAGRGAAWGAASGSVAGGAGGGEALRRRMEESMINGYQRAELKGIDLVPGARTEGLIFFPVVEMASVQMLMDSEIVDIPIMASEDGSTKSVDAPAVPVAPVGPVAPADPHDKH